MGSYLSMLILSIEKTGKSGRIKTEITRGEQLTSLGIAIPPPDGVKDSVICYAVRSADCAPLLLKPPRDVVLRSETGSKYSITQFDSDPTPPARIAYTEKES